MKDGQGIDIILKFKNIVKFNLNKLLKLKNLIVTKDSKVIKHPAVGESWDGNVGQNSVK